MSRSTIRNTIGFFLCLVGTGLASVADATIEVPAMFDARSVGMGGTGVAFAENATAAYVNPALLDGIKKLDITADFSPARPVLTVPLMGENRSSTGAIFPLFFVGGAMRLHERITAGIAFYPTAGTAAKYELPGELEASSSIAMMELNVPVAVRITDGLSFGLGYRLTYLSQKITSPSTDVAGATNEMSLSGFSYAGVDAGISYRPMPALRLGLAYRSKVVVRTKGDFEVSGAKQGDLESSFASPHAIRGGAAVSLLGDKLLLALDVKYLMYRESNKSLDITIKTPAGNMEQSQWLNWKNSVSLHLGFEYAAMDMLRLRAGYSLVNSATPDNTAGPFVVPPGLIHTIHVGAGVPFGQWSIDAGFFYGFASRTINDQPAVTPGDYKMTMMELALSANYHM